MKIISPKTDFCAKELFSHETIRKHFISDVTGIRLEDIRSVHLSNTYLWKRHRKQKQGILDVLIELNGDAKVNIELQVVVTGTFFLPRGEPIVTMLLGDECRIKIDSCV